MNCPVDATPVISVVAGQAHTRHDCQPIRLAVAEEVPVALVYNGISHVVLMTTPQHLPELAYGFSLSEGIIEHPHQIYQLDLQPHDAGITVEMTVSAACFAALKQRRRQLAGRTGCGLCGIEALAQLHPPLPTVTAPLQITDTQLQAGFAALAQAQQINQSTGGCHAAGLLQADGTLTVFEDVGRHNALDKLIGWRALHGQPDGALLLTSRLSYELIQKAAVAGLSTIAAISAPTGLAVRLAQQAGMQLAVFVREGRVTWLGAGDQTPSPSGRGLG